MACFFFFFFFFSFFSLLFRIDGYGITFNCLDEKPAKVTVCTYDGQNWEQTYSTSDIAQLSKEKS